MWYVVETYIKSTSWKRYYFVTSSLLIHVNFKNQESFSWYQQKLKIGKVTFFSKSTYYWKKIFISRYDMIIFIYKSWSGWLLCMLKSHVMWFFWFQNDANYILFATTKFLVSTLLIFKENSEIFNSFFCGQKGITVTINFTNKKFIR